MAGLLLMASGLASYAYPLYGEWRHSLGLQRPADESVLAERPSASATPLGPDGPTPTATSQPTPRPEATPEPTPTPTPTPTYGPPVWIVIPSIGVDAAVVEMQPSNGSYWVPGYDVGHHADSPNPGEPGNSAYTGHVATIDAGKVFARLKDVKVGDAIYVYTKTHRTDWVAISSTVHVNKDASFLSPTTEPTLTLYTCYGKFDWTTMDFSHRIVVTARLVGVTPRTATDR